MKIRQLIALLSLVLLLPVFPLVLGNIMGGLSGILGGGQRKTALDGGYPSTLSLTMGDAGFNTAADVILLLPAAGAKARIWEFTVPGGNWKYRWGSGNPLNNQGYWWFAAADAATDICNGIVTLGYESYDRHTQDVIEEKNDVVLNTGTVTSIATLKLQDKNFMQALPEGGAQGKGGFVQQFSRLFIDYRTIVRATAEDIMDFNIPITIYS